MKKYLFTLIIFLSVYAIQTGVAQERHYGATIEDSNPIAMGDLLKQLEGKPEMAATVEGKVSSVCQTKGCWMMLEKGDGTTMRVTFKDYEFFVPKDIAGSTVIIQGIALVNTTSVEELRHYAEDAKKSKEEIESITEPKTELVFEAAGVIVK